MDIKRFQLGPLGTNCYVITDDGYSMVVDPGGTVDNVLTALGDARLDMILLTHGHWDHRLGVAQLSNAYPQALIAMHEIDAELAADSSKDGSRHWGVYVQPHRVDKRLVDGDVIELGSLRFRVIHTPGHTAGSCCFHEARQGILLAGDTLFAGGGWGRTDLPTGSPADIASSIRYRLSQLPDETTVYSGHGQSSTIGAERRLNSLLRRL